jgi:hypothetical protein
LTGNDDTRIAVGGAIASVDGAPVVRGNRITDNTATGEPFGFGGGIFVASLGSLRFEPVIMSNDISENTANWGGGIAALDSSPIVEQNAITGNTAVSNGGGVEFQPADPGSTPGGAPIIIDNTITGNRAQDGFGGGISGYGPTGSGIPLIAGNEVTGNQGGGIRINAYVGPNEANIERCIVSDNTIYGIRCDNDATPTIEFCDVSANGNGIYCLTGANPTIHYNDICDNVTYGVFSLSTTVTIDAELNWWGDASGPYHPTTNPSGLGNRVSDNVDYEPWSIASGVAPSEAQASPGRFVLSQNHPNPFNPLTTIEFWLPRNDRVTLAVYDVHGQEVEKLVDGMQATGRHTVSWDASGKASGVYFYRIEAGDWAATRRMILVK